MAEISQQPAEDAAARTIALATAALSEAQLAHLARVSAAAAARVLNGLNCVKLGILGDGTLTLLGPAIAGSALRHGVAMGIVEGAYNSALQEATDPGSQLHTAGLDMALVVLDARILGLDRAAATADEAQARVAGAFERVKRIVEGLRPSVGSALLVQTIAPPIEPLFGSFDRMREAARNLFALVAARSTSGSPNGRRPAPWCWWTSRILAATVELEAWDEAQHWRIQAELLARDAPGPTPTSWPAPSAAVLGQVHRKCLVLDLDNTLWGGVIGDRRAWAGIALRAGSAAGEAFIADPATPRWSSGRRGIVAGRLLEERGGRGAGYRSEEHPDMLLKRERPHCAYSRANWADKAADLRAIAQALNIGHRRHVSSWTTTRPSGRRSGANFRRRRIPKLPEDPALYPQGPWPPPATSKRSALSPRRTGDRARLLQANAPPRGFRSRRPKGNGRPIWASLDDGSAPSAPWVRVTRPRVAQLINKSNQFNLTTHRYSEAEVAKAETDPRRHAIQIRLTDSFGDNGIISVVIADKSADAWEIDTWLMSCRVLGRRVEEAVLAHLAAAARAAGADALIGRYVPSPKNKMVAQHYEKLGFSLVESLPDETTVYRLDLSDFVAPELPMRVEDTALTTLKASA